MATSKLPPLLALRAFEAVARHCSFKQAAAELAVTPTAISHQIRQLETYLGRRVLDRTPRSVTLTTDGASLCEVTRTGFKAIAAREGDTGLFRSCPAGAPMTRNSRRNTLLTGLAAGPVLALCVAVGGTADNGSPWARALQARIITLDSHLDTPANFSNEGWSILDRHDPKTRSQVDYPRLVEGELDGGFWAIYTPQGGRTPADNLQSRDQGLRRLVEIRELLAAHPDKFELALTADDASRIKKEGKRIVYISIENASPLASDPSLLSAYYKLGVRVLGLVHTSNNDFADSATDKPEWHGLSPKGRALVAEANRLGIVIDQSHASDEVFDQLLELSKAPIILSHTSSSAVHANPRNIDDERIRKLAAKGGVIQVNSLSGYLIEGGETPEYRQEIRALREEYKNQGPGPTKDQELERRLDALNAQYKIRRATFNDYVVHIKHILEVAGPDHVGFGADWDGGGGVTGLEDVSQLPKITDWLLKAGYTEQQIANIWGGNLLRVIHKAQSLAQSPPLTATTPKR